MQFVIFLFSGTLFGVGLALSGMINPAKVVGFVDFTGNWDPSLLFVMGGAVVTAGIGFRLVTKKPMSLLGLKMMIPTRTDIDLPLLAGSGLFGIGWGLGGFCPGPAFASLYNADMIILTFLASMTIGTLALQFVRKPAYTKLAVS